jgi:peptidoglycan/LPS O-acetylase OafA/YrhL
VGLIGSFQRTKAEPPFQIGDRRIPELDGLRAISVLLVFVFHAFPYRLPGGHIGVDVFFVLSGYLITGILLKEWGETATISFRSFYWRRTLRLMPAFLLLLVVYVAILPAIFGRDHAIAAASSLYAMNWIRAFDLGPTGFLGHTWSLAIEEQFYLIWPVILLAIARFGRAFIRAFLCAAIIAVVLWRFYLVKHGASVDRLYNGFDTRADALLIGCLLACSPRLRYLLGRFWPIALVFVAAEVLKLRFTSPLLPSGVFTLTAIAAASLISALVDPKDSVLRIALRAKPLVQLGTISYGFYLWHYVFIAALANLHFKDYSVALIAFPATVTVSWLSFKYVEAPVKSGGTPFLKKLSKFRLIFYDRAPPD